MEISKFILVLALAFWITVGIFLMWESIMPEAARRLSTAAVAVIANSVGLMPQNENKDNEQENYPFVVDLPNSTQSAIETNVKGESLQQIEPSSTKIPSTSTKEPQPDTLPSETSKKELISSSNKSLPEPPKKRSSVSANEPETPKEEVTNDESSKPLPTSTSKNSLPADVEQKTAAVSEVQPEDEAA